MEDKEYKQASTQAEYFISKKDLPLSCPMKGMMLWNAHPRVFLPIEESGEETCPYCGAKFKLIDS